MTPVVGPTDPLATAAALLAQAASRPEGDEVRAALVEAAQLVMAAACPKPAPAVLPRVETDHGVREGRG